MSQGLGAYEELLSSLRTVESNGSTARDASIAKSAGSIIVSAMPAAPSSSSSSTSRGDGSRRKGSSRKTTSGVGSDEVVFGPSIAHRLGTLTLHTAPTFHVEQTAALIKEQATLSLVDEIVQGSKLLNKVSYLPPHLQTFKLDFERFQAKKIRLPTLHQQLSPRTKKRIAQLPPSSAEESSAVEKYLSMANSTRGAKAYENIAVAVTKSRIQAQQNHVPEEHLLRAEKEAETRSKIERVLMPLPVLADTGLSQEQLTRHDSTEFFTALEEKRKQDAIKASISSRFIINPDDSFDVEIDNISQLGSSIVGGSSTGKHSFESHLASYLGEKLSLASKSRNSSPTVNQSDPSVELYGTISDKNDRGELIYDDRGNLRPRNLAASYAEVFQEAENVHSKISTRFSALQQAVQVAHSQNISFKKSEKSLLDEIKTRCYDDLGLDLDAKFTAVRIAAKAVNMMMFYMIEVRLKGSFLKFKEQTRLASIARREKAAAFINRVARGMVARAETRKIRRIVYMARDLERRTAETRQTARRKAAMCLTRSIRFYGKMRIFKLNRRNRIAATCIQRHARGILGRIRVHRLRNWNEWLKFNAIRIQCAFRQHMGRRKVCVLRKIRVVQNWEHEANRVSTIKSLNLRRMGSASFIIHCYRAYRIRCKLKIIIHWHRVELAIMIQKCVRGYFDRKLVKRMKKRKFDRERVVREAAMAIQKIARGRQARTNVYKPRLAEKVKELLAKRRAKAKYLKEAAKNNVMRVFYGTLRTFVPFRYEILRQRAILIQRVYRGHRARSRMFLMKVRASINAMNKRYFGGYNGALQLQRLYRGYRYRRDKLKAKRRAAALVLQCAFRCSQSRWAVMQKKIHRDAMMLIGRNMLYMLRFKKAQRIRRENRKYKHQAVMIQRFARGYLGRLRYNIIKTDKRSSFERSKVNDLRLNHVLASVQLRIIMESIERPLGDKPESLCEQECYARGPVQAIFCAAVGKKARLDFAALPTNKMESGNFLKFALRIKGLMENGRPETEDFDDIFKPPKVLDTGSPESKISTLKTSGGQGSRLAQGKGISRGGAGAGPGPGRGTRKRVEKVKVRSMPLGQFALIDAIRSGGIAVAPPKKQLSKLDLEMIFAKARQEGQKELRYFDFIESVSAAAAVFYGCAQDDDDNSLDSSSANARFRRGAVINPSDVTASILGPDDSNALGSADDLSAMMFKDEEGEDVLDNAEIEAGESREISTSAERAMKERRREEKLKKRTGKTVRVKATVNDGKLLWPLKEITSKSKPNYKVLLILRMIDSWRNQEWFLDLAEWMELEARARVGVIVKRMQNMFWHMKSAAFRALMRDRIGARQLIEEYNQTVVAIQTLVRRFISKARVQRAAQVFLIKYIPDVGEPYWYNRSTRVTSKAKPAILGPYDCLSVALPPPGLEFVIQCSNCASSAIRNCWECEDSYCKTCYENLHCKGKRRLHHHFPIPMCGYCKFQVASKCCITCITVKPEPGSAQEQMKESDRGTLCDYCFTHLHDEEDRYFDPLRATKKSQMRQIFARSREAYLIKHHLKQGVVTDHKFDFLVQECEECSIRAASWRCGDCKQIYCNTCLVGLHSLGGPFSTHRAEKLPFYTREMHQSFLTDQRTQIFQHKMEAVKHAWHQRAEAHRYKSIVRIQAWWRKIFHGLRRGRLMILKGRKRDRRAWRLRRAEMPIRNSTQYKILDFMGLAPALLSDTREEQVLKRITVFGKQFAREYIWKNKASFGFYQSGKSAHWKKGDPKRGFDVGELEELQRQARQGGFRMPGKVILTQGETKHTTTHDLREFIKKGMLIRLNAAYFMVRHVSENSIRLDRIWRWESVPDGTVCYRLPAYSDEPRRLQFKVMYYLSNFAISNPLSQSFFRTHNRFFESVRGAAEYIEQVHKNLGFRRGSMEWRRYAQKLEKRAKWSHDLLDDTSAEVVDLSNQKSFKEKKPGAEGGGGAVAAALQAAAAAGEFRMPEEDSEDENVGDEKPKERAPGERWYATEQELAARLAAEAAMSLDDLIATHDQWEECIDPMTENIFWTHKITFEMVADMPAALKAKIAKEAKEGQDKKNREDALAKLNAAKGLNAHGKKKTAVGMSGRR